MGEIRTDRKEVEEAEAFGDVPAVDSLTFRKDLTDLLDRTRYQGARAVITRHGKPYAALVPVADLRRLLELEAAAAHEGAA
jgi:prevent-host-death family protein